MRASGILMPIFSLPGRYGIGCFSREAYRFVDFLAQAGQRYWQILPVGPTSYGDSPYQSFSTFAGNPYFISLETLTEEGFLTEKDCAPCDFGADGEKIDYARMYQTRFGVLKKAWHSRKAAKVVSSKSYRAFAKENADWLPDYALFMALKDAHGGKSFYEWEDALRLREKSAIAAAQKKYADEVGFYEFVQYEFFRQWMALKAYANEKNISVIGDIPIYVAGDSADVWTHPELFQMDEDGRPEAVAGCPPDVFSATGQLWGNPLYRWKYHKKTKYAWWIRRLAMCNILYDVVRIDHFRGFDEYWSVPAGDNTAENGQWLKGPNMRLFRRVKKKLPGMRIIAEDLGLMTDSVRKMVRDSGYPNMKVVGFAWDGRELTKEGQFCNDFLPFRFDHNCVCYTGTHDNETILGWLTDTANEAQLAEAEEYLGIRPVKTDEDGRPDEDTLIRMADGLVQISMSSPADTCIIPLQDYLHLGNEARINFPSTLGGNWEWRAKHSALTPELADHIRRMTVVYGRL